ncbi:hypothetical protein [Phaeobacter sp.]|uniref:hypothetical protein n=1 Tax=Phaeobacter sp. TaxID=1902409 RepID=UPI0025F4315D|nr:hypothetical protein [Phaeobacter sp.]
MIWVDDLVQVLANAGSAQQAAGGAYHLSQDECPTLDLHARRIAALIGMPFPDWDIRPIDKLVAQGYRLAAFPFPLGRAALLDTAAAKHDLGFAPTDGLIALRSAIAVEADLVPWPGAGSMQAGLSGTTWLLHEALDQLTQTDAQPPSISLETALSALGTDRSFSPVHIVAERNIADQLPMSRSDAATDMTPVSVIVAPETIAVSSDLDANCIAVPLAHLVDCSSGTVSVFRQVGRDHKQDYAKDHLPDTVQIADFASMSGFDQTLGSPLLLQLNGIKNQAAARDWAKSLATAKGDKVFSIPALAPIWPVGVPPNDYVWQDLFGLARVLRQLPAMQANGDTMFSLFCIGSCNLTEAFLPLAPPWYLVRVTDENILVHLTKPRVLALPPFLADVLRCACVTQTAEDCLALCRESPEMHEISQFKLIEALAQLSASTGIALRPSLTSPPS